MSRESRIMEASALGAQETISHYEAFGWELLSLNGTQITMSRETQNPAYDKLLKYQMRYEELERQYLAIANPVSPQKPAKFDLGRCLILLLLGILPGALYITYKAVKYSAYKCELEEYNNEVEYVRTEKNKIYGEMKRIVMESRALFFGKNN